MYIYIIYPTTSPSQNDAKRTLAVIFPKNEKLKGDQAIICVLRARTVGGINAMPPKSRDNWMYP